MDSLLDLKIKTTKDIPLQELQELLNQTLWAKNRKTEDLSIMIENSDLIFAVFHDEKLVGFARVLTDYIFRATLWDVVIHSSFHKKGVGSFLMEHILSHPDLSQIKKIWLFTTDKHVFYEKFGFISKNGSMLLEK